MRVVSFAQLRPLKGIPFTRRWVARMVAEGTFPQPVRLSERRIAWREDEIDQWIEQRERVATLGAKA